MVEDEMVREHHELNGHESEETPRDGDGQGSLACCSPLGCKELDTTQQLNTDHKIPPPPGPNVAFCKPRGVSEDS